MEFIVKVPGSCGELVQGMISDEPFLITCPIDLYTTVTVSDEFVGHFGLGWKSEAMLEKTLRYFSCNQFNFGIKLESELPHGKGMASSSADIAAVGKAVSLALNVEITAQEIAALATTIEPTDGIFYNGIVAMNPVTGKLLSNSFAIPEYNILIFDFGSQINTLEFKRRSNFFLNELPVTLDMNLVTASALANQSILYKSGLEEIVEFSKSLGALRVNVAHTGTVIGIIFNEYMESGKIDEYSKVITDKFPQISFMTKTKIISGGFKVNFDQL